MRRRGLVSNLYRMARLDVVGHERRGSRGEGLGLAGAGELAAFVADAGQPTEMPQAGPGRPQGTRRPPRTRYPAFERLSGLRRDESIGGNASVFGSLQSPAATEAMQRTVSAGASWSGDGVIRRRDGTKRVVEASISPVRDADGTMTGLVTVVRDAADERALAVERARLATAVEQTSDSVTIDRPRGHDRVHLRPAVPLDHLPRPRGRCTGLRLQRDDRGLATPGGADVGQHRAHRRAAGRLLPASRSRRLSDLPAGTAAIRGGPGAGGGGCVPVRADPVQLTLNSPVAPFEASLNLWVTKG